MTDKKACCQRCGDDGPDLRTLWMACLYEMNELGMPFYELAIDGTVKHHVRDDSVDFIGHMFRKPVFEARSDAKANEYRFYTLRVCKRCRGEWMSAIRQWFDANPPAEESCGSGIFVRRNGATIEITRDEWDREHHDA